MNGVLLKVMNKRKRRATVGLLADAKLLAAFHTSRARYSLCRKLEALYQTNHGNAVCYYTRNKFQMIATCSNCKETACWPTNIVFARVSI